ncbi:MAG: peptide-binding protein [Vulcanimicrobiaceae bacterium]
MAPRDPGAVRFDLAADPANLNPLFAHQDAASVELQAARLAFEPFIDLDQNGRPHPALLTVVPTTGNGGISADGRTLTYHLRPNVRWQDGRPVTSDDVLFTLRAIVDKHNAVRSTEGYDLVDRASAPDARTVVLHLRKRWAPAAQTLFSYGINSQFVLPAHLLQGQSLAQSPFNAAPVGDGPYRFVSWKRGEKLVYEANPRYWRGAPRAKRLDIRIVPDPSTNLTLLSSGELDWNLIAPMQQALLKSNRSIDYRIVPTATIAGVAINMRHPPLDDVRIRRALAMSIDREGISTKITLGRYRVTNSAQPQFSWAYDAGARLPNYNPKAADALFESAGWKRGAAGMRSKGGKPLQLTYVQFPETGTGVRAATVIVAELRERGVDAQIKSISNAQLFLPRTGILAIGNYDLAYVPWTMGADPDDSAVLGCHGISNYMGYCNARVDRLQAQALSAPTQAERKSKYAQIARIVAHDVPIIYLFDAYYIYAYRTELRGYYPNAFIPTWNAWRWEVR